MKLAKFLNAFKRDENGVTGLEYAILAAIVVVALVSQKDVIPKAFTTAFGAITNAVTSAVPDNK